MELSRGARIDFIRKIRDSLEAQSWEDRDLILTQHGVEKDWQESVQSVLTQSSSEILTELAQYLRLDAAADPQVIPEEQSRFRVFVSHIAKYKADVKAVVEQFDNVFKFETYMAHDSIVGGTKWADEIRSALSNTHAGVAFYHEGFRDSAYCPQEVGWLLGRGVPVESVKCGETPFGFAGETQAFKMPAPLGGKLERNRKGIRDLCLEIAKRFARDDRALPHISYSLGLAFLHSPEYNTTDYLIDLLEDIQVPLELDDCRNIAASLSSNDQVYKAQSSISERVMGKLKSWHPAEFA